MDVERGEESVARGEVVRSDTSATAQGWSLANSGAGFDIAWGAEVR